MSNFFTEILQSIKKTSTERISNPFYGVLIFSWITLNWESVAILIFSDLKMQERVSLINSEYPIKIFWPFVIAVILTFLLPWCTEKITFFQSKPISRTSTLMAIRRKRMLLADISVERFRAKRDVTYERHKVGAEKEVQEMRLAIVSSKEKTGQLTDELNKAVQKISELTADLDKSITTESLQAKKIEEIHKILSTLEIKNKSLLNELSEKNRIMELYEKDKTLFIKSIDEKSMNIDKANKVISDLKAEHEDEIELYKKVLSQFKTQQIKESLMGRNVTQEEYIKVMDGVKSYFAKNQHSD
ncbi:hypothetical protein [Pantoea ananatis]|uniref:hypothetical protein n=1 Tax=Pantoea ananas TaxID=553 RepID=UPI002449CB3C|nr:hypothetical protein [Pantoea ananatis]MDH0055764.1 hypothetical protein [Pantoea ananatis]